MTEHSNNPANSRRVPVVAVVGACAPERNHYANRLAEMTDRMMIPANRLAMAPNPPDEAAALAPWADTEIGALAEFPSTTPVAEIIGALSGSQAPTILTDIVCVVDALHLLDDLTADDYIATAHDTSGHVIDCVARALLTVRQIEYASMIVLANWETLSTPDLSTVMALASHLSPKARLQLQRDDFIPTPERAVYRLDAQPAGWTGVLTSSFEPHMIDSRVSAFRYEQLRPLHPGRLQKLLDDRIETQEFGHIVRSAGFCKFATSARATLQWDHVGTTIAFHIAAIDAGFHPVSTVKPSGRLFAVGQELAFVGLDLDTGAITQAFDEAALTDDEFAAGPEAWVELENPFPTWSPAQDLPR